MNRLAHWIRRHTVRKGCSQFNKWIQQIFMHSIISKHFHVFLTIFLRNFWCTDFEMYVKAKSEKRANNFELKKKHNRDVRRQYKDTVIPSRIDKYINETDMWLYFISVFITWCRLHWIYFLASGIFVPQERIKSVPPAMKAWILNHWTPREVPRLHLKSMDKAEPFNEGN